MAVFSKPGTPKTTASSSAQPSSTSKSSKVISSESAIKTVCSKAKKKIHKNHDVRKDHSKRLP